MEEIFRDQAEISKYRRKFLYSNVLNSSLYILENAEVYKAFHMKHLRVIQVANQVQFEKNIYHSLQVFILYSSELTLHISALESISSSLYI